MLPEKFNKLKTLVLAYRITLILVAVVLLVGIGGFAAFQKFTASKNSVPAQEVDLTFDAEGPYALLLPRRDGNAVLLNLKRTSSYNKISYELAYTSLSDSLTTSSGDEVASGGVDRGVVGEVKTDQRKGEYEQEILFGTCSKNICKYDKGVENGTLTLHIKKGNQAYRMITQWHLQKPDVSLGKLSSGDGHFTYTITSAGSSELSLIGFTIINDVTGMPKLPDGKTVSGKVYALNVPAAKDLMSGEVKIELADNPGVNAKIARYGSGQNKWIEYDTKINGSILTASADSAGIFAVLVPIKK